MIPYTHWENEGQRVNIHSGLLHFNLEKFCLKAWVCNILQWTKEGWDLNKTNVLFFHFTQCLHSHRALYLFIFPNVYVELNFTDLVVKIDKYYGCLTNNLNSIPISLFFIFILVNFILVCTHYYRILYQTVIVLIKFPV